MNLHDFIFLKGSFTIRRHISFWFIWLIFSATVQLTNIKPGQVIFGDLVFYQVLRSLTRMPSIIIFCYSTIYFFIPRFINTRKYFAFAVYYTSFLCVLYLFNYYVQSPMYGLPGTIVGNSFRNMQLTPFTRKFYSFYSNFNFTGAIPTCCMMMIIKYYKVWYENKIKNEMLNRENKQAELQLLKAQIHPHFLFNTLNNIYSFTLTGSPKAEDLVNKLSGMMDYITTEGEKSLVPLIKELQFINDYIGLENVRYGDRLDMTVTIEGYYHDKLITPLLMIPFVENCFKHGASEMRGQQWINLAISVNNAQLDFRLSNSKPAQPNNKNSKNGIGLTNVKKRLELLYPGKYLLNIESTSDKYSVHMQVLLMDAAEPGILPKTLNIPSKSL